VQPPRKCLHAYTSYVRSVNKEKKGSTPCARYLPSTGHLDGPLSTLAAIVATVIDQDVASTTTYRSDMRCERLSEGGNCGGRVSLSSARNKGWRSRKRGKFCGGCDARLSLETRVGALALA
jgi:hypothetical protein